MRILARRAEAAPSRVQARVEGLLDRELPAVEPALRPRLDVRELAVDLRAGRADQAVGIAVEPSKD